MTASYRRTELILGLVLLAAVPALADKKSDLYDAAVKAGSAGNLEEAARLFCEVGKYKDAEQMCKLMTQEAERERKKSNDRFEEGQRAFESGDFDTAEQKFKNVRVGPKVQEARDYLRRIPAARAEKSGAEQERASFEQGVQAYQRNDFGAARGLFEKISGNRRGEAQNYLNNIRRYEEAMTAGDRDAASNPQQAIIKYSEAAGIKPDGPGDPRGKAARLQSQVNAAAAAPSPAATTARSATPPPPPSQPARTEVAGAVKASATRVDVAKLLREAEAARRAGQMGAASGKYLAVLAADAGNAEARKGLAEISAQGGGKQTAGSEADVMLAKAIREFYTGLYEQSEVHIKDYLDAQGSKIGLSQFYLGASMLSRYYLGGEKADDRRLLEEAKDAFKRAKSAPGFKAPDAKLVSPKILKVYQEVTS